MKINKEEQMLGLESQSEYKQIDELEVRKEPYDKLWSTAVTFHQVCKHLLLYLTITHTQMHTQLPTHT